VVDILLSWEHGRFECLGGYGFGQSETGYDFTFLDNNSGVAKGLSTGILFRLTLALQLISTI